MNLEHLVIDNIRRIRKEKGITQEKLAEYCGTSASYIGLMETYKNVPVQAIFAEKSDDYAEAKARASVCRSRIKQEIMQSVENCLDTALKVL